MAEDSPNGALEESMRRALDGDREAVSAFYRAFLAGPLYVPLRRQAQALQHQPQYPDQLTSLLGIESQSGVHVPVFSRPDLIAEWCGQPLEYRVLDGKLLLTLIPEEWHLSINPGSDAGKEMTPWEIRELRLGPEAIAGLADELLMERPVELLNLEEPLPHEYPALRQRLVEQARAIPELKNLYLLKEGSDCIILGIDAECRTNERLQAIRDEVSAAARLALIGEDRLKVLAGCGLESVGLGAFRGSRPIYTRPATSLFARLKRLFTRGGS